MSNDSPNTNIRNILKHQPLFQALNEDQLDRVNSGTSELRVEKGDILFHRGDACSGFHIVVYGQIKLSVTSPQGSQKVVEIIGPRQSFGEAVMFLQRPYPVMAEALSDALILHVARTHVIGLLEADPTFSLGLLAGLSVRLHSLLHDVESYSLRSSTQRVIGYLLQQCPEEPDSVDISLPTSKLVIASRLNLTPETLSRVLHDLARHQLIDVQGRVIHVPSIKKLQSFDV